MTKKLTAIKVSFPPTKYNPKLLLSVTISMVVSFPGTIRQEDGSATGSAFKKKLTYLKKMFHNPQKTFSISQLHQ